MANLIVLTNLSCWGFRVLVWAVGNLVGSSQAMG